MKILKYAALVLSVTAVLAGCKSETKEKKTADSREDTTQQRPYEAISLLGDTLYALEIPGQQKTAYEAALQTAQEQYQRQPEKLENILALGHWLSATHHYQQAIQVYTRGMQHHPESPELYRHRGQRLITVRQFDKALQDLETSKKLVEGLPEAVDYSSTYDSGAQHTSSLQFNIYYHLGLAYYLQGAYGKAAQTYESCLGYSQHPEETAATADWLYLTYRKLGEDEIAEKTLDHIKEDMDMKDSQGYFEKILMYKGLVEPDSLLLSAPNPLLPEQHMLLTNKAYGAGSFHLANGDTEKGIQILTEVVDGSYWVGLGYIAAEAELAQLRKHEMLP